MMDRVDVLIKEGRGVHDAVHPVKPGFGHGKRHQRRHRSPPQGVVFPVVVDLAELPFGKRFVDWAHQRRGTDQRDHRHQQRAAVVARGTLPFARDEQEQAREEQLQRDSGQNVPTDVGPQRQRLQRLGAAEQRVCAEVIKRKRQILVLCKLMHRVPNCQAAQQHHQQVGRCGFRACMKR